MISVLELVFECSSIGKCWSAVYTNETSGVCREIPSPDASLQH